MINRSQRTQLINLKCCIEAEGPIDGILAAQYRTHESLQRGIETLLPRDQFLRNYDSIMRVIEAWLVEQSLMFGQSPHKGLRIILQSHGALSANHPIDDLIALRHRVKKDGISPSVQQLRQLQDLYADVKNDFRPQQHGEG